MNTALRDALKELRLSGLAESLEVRLQEAASSRLNHAEFLELILEDELAVRRDRKVARRIKAAAFRDPKVSFRAWRKTPRKTASSAKELSRANTRPKKTRAEKDTWGIDAI